ncbi:threonine-phosphate decarboxylase CobD [Myxosarcina sp. GI1]|uniref:threonine-phosphate decarboxylase CobD n=1 Tax=Myxosarcina sp. GI1 TaxID=1541065 RepID=UPI00055C05DE|nr:threonine-phosphate decarboxylase CobD [Myxosarcina sp. GI1]
MSRPKHGGNLAWAAAIAGCPVSAILDFSASINPLGLPQSAIAAINNNLERLTAYPDPNYARLRSVLGDYHNLSPDYILPGNGSAELLTWAARELAQQEVTYLVTPAFGDYQRALSAFNANISVCHWLEFPRNTQPKLNRAGIIINNPHNPTGNLWTREEILPYLERFELVVVDEAFMDFLPSDREQSLIAWVKDFPNLIILRSLTKFYSLPGLRIGYAIAHPHRLQRWQQWRDPWSVNILAALVTEAVLQDYEFQQRTWEWLPTARSQLFEGLSKIPQLQPLAGAANFLLVKSEISCTQLQQTLLKQDKILIRDCLSFPELGDRYFRVAVRLAEDNQILVSAIARILQKD